MNITKRRLLPGLAVAALLVAELALAHARLSSSTPMDQAVVDSAPQEVALHFSEPVKLTALTLVRDGEAGEDLAPLPADMRADFAIPVAAMTSGRYVLKWRALSKDTHVMSGEVSFTVRTETAGSGRSSAH